LTVKNNEYYFELFESVNSYNGTLKYYEAYTEIGAIQTDKLLDILYSWFDCLNNSLSIDHKMIDLVGGIFREVEGFDRLLLHDFLVKESNEVTLSLLSAFLEGYWSATHTVDKEAVSQLEKLFNNLDSTSPGKKKILFLKLILIIILSKYLCFYMMLRLENFIIFLITQKTRRHRNLKI